MNEVPINLPFNRTSLAGGEMAYMSEAVANGHVSGDGPFTKQCHSLLESTLGSRKALLTTSCTHALEMCGLLLDLKPGDEIIVPSFTFVSTANAFALRGARLVFSDIRADTLNIDEQQLERLISPKTRAIVVVHYAGIACEMYPIMRLAERHGVMIIEDNAHGLFGTYSGKPLGTFGALATQSFHETKNFSCGEGGALLINDPAYIERAEILREKGTDRSRFFRGQVDKYTWVDYGSSYLPSDILAAFLLAQLENRDQIQMARQKIWDRYHESLRDWAAKNSVGLPHVPAACGQAYHLYYLLLPSLEARQSLIAKLRAQGILSVFHYLPLHRSDMGLRCGIAPHGCPVTDDVSDRLIRLPFFNSMTETEQQRVITEVTSLNLSDFRQ